MKPAWLRRPGFDIRLPWRIRRFVTPLVRGIPVRIRAGPNEGCRWSIAASGRHTWGRFDNDRLAVVRALITAGDCVWDAGAHHGYLTLTASRLAGASGRVYAFEPSPYNLAFLRAHIRWNALRNVHVLPVALGARDGPARFGGRGSSQTFQLGAGRDAVEMRSIASLLAEGLRPPDLFKLDVEGAEGEILEAGARHLPRTAMLLVSIHSHHNYERVVAALTVHGFEILESAGVRRLRARADWGRDDPDLLAVGPDRRGVLERVSRLSYFRG